MPHLDATFTLEDWQQTSLPSIEDGPDTGTGQADKVYSGDLEGTSTVFMLMTQGDGGAAYLAQERIEGTLDERDGTFVLQHGASGAAGETPEQWAMVVPGSGTGGLASLRGRGRLDHGVLALDYELD
jgi:hypothetical protein